METGEEIKRGVDFETRVGETQARLRQAFAWWKGGRLNKRTLLFVSIVWVLNFLIVFPIFGRNLTQAYSSSAFLILVSEFFQRIFIPQHFFFSVLTFFSLTFAPVSFYLFVRKIVMRHDITALIAALFFILPNPFLGNTPILLAAVLRGDGAHVLAVSFLPFFFLYVQTFIMTGAPALFLLTVIGISYIAIVSPFALFNFLIIFTVLLIAEGFQGNLRIKVIRAFLLLLTAGSLSFFWYYPSVLVEFMAQTYIQNAIEKFFGILPAAIPIIPVAGALSFLIFDRREKLKPVFVSLSLFLVYSTAYGVSNQLGMSGMLSAERYLPELMLSVSFLLAIVFIFLSGLAAQNFLSKLKKKFSSIGVLILIIVSSGVVGFMTFQGISIVHLYIQSERIIHQYSEGVASVRGLVDFRDITSIAASLVSLGTFLFLLYVVRKYPTRLRREVIASSRSGDTRGKGNRGADAGAI